MRNVVLLKVELSEELKPLSDERLVATFTLVASEKNTQDAILTDGKGPEVDIPAGMQFRFERVDLNELLVRSKAGEVMFVVGHTAG